MDYSLYELDLTIKKCHGGLLNFCKKHNIPYYKAGRALNDSENPYYKDTIKEIENLVKDNRDFINQENKRRELVKTRIIRNYGSLKKCSRDIHVDYSKLRKYIIGQTFNMPKAIELLLVNSGVLKKTEIIFRE